eukprot:scaffold214831_cov45-Prasinocladus_malaysianus.AAC.1
MSNAGCLLLKLSIQRYHLIPLEVENSSSKCLSWLYPRTKAHSRRHGHAQRSAASPGRVSTSKLGLYVPDLELRGPGTRSWGRFLSARETRWPLDYPYEQHP